MITFHRETWAQYYSDSQRALLWQEHYDAFKPVHQGKMPMSPWVEVYENAERLGGLECIVAREAGVMVGYCLLFVKPHIHYSQTLCGFEDSYFLTARCRKGLAGYRLLKYSVEVLRQRGCVRAFFMTKQFNTIETILIRLGFAKLDTCLAIWL